MTLADKRNAYGMSQEIVTLLASYLGNPTQRVKVVNCESDWEPLQKCFSMTYYRHNTI